MRGAYLLDPSPDDMRSVGEEVLRYLVSFVKGLVAAPAATVDRGVERRPVHHARRPRSVRAETHPGARS
jgi:hypothetical protein